MKSFDHDQFNARVNQNDDFEDIFDSFSHISHTFRSRSADHQSTDFYRVTQPALYDVAWGIPNAFKMPPAFQRRFEDDDETKELEKGFYAGFQRKSFNSNAEMSREQEEAVGRILQQLRWATKNSETDLKLPFDPKMLYNKKFTNQAQALLQKLMKTGKFDGDVDAKEMQPPKRKQRPLTSKADRRKYWKQKKGILDESWYDKHDPERQPNWPKYYEHAKAVRVGEDPQRDPRPLDIQKWRRPEDPDKIISRWEQEQIALQDGKPLKTLLGAELVKLLKKEQNKLKHEIKTFHPEREVEKH